MSVTLAIFSSLGVCIVGGILEGLAAGNNVKPFFAKLRFSPYSAPLWTWYIIGALYYVTCFVILYRFLRHNGDTPIWNASFALILIVMATNAVWNYIFFRAQNLLGAFLLGFPYALVARWGYGLLKLNKPSES